MIQGAVSESLWVDGVEDVVEVVGEEEFVKSEPADEGALELVDILATAFCNKATCSDSLDVLSKITGLGCSTSPETSIQRSQVFESGRSSTKVVLFTSSKGV